MDLVAVIAFSSPQIVGWSMKADLLLDALDGLARTGTEVGLIFQGDSNSQYCDRAIRKCTAWLPDGPFDGHSIDGLG